MLPANSRAERIRASLDRDAADVWGGLSIALGVRPLLMDACPEARQGGLRRVWLATPGAPDAAGAALSVTDWPSRSMRQSGGTRASTSSASAGRAGSRRATSASRRARSSAYSSGVWRSRVTCAVAAAVDSSDQPGAAPAGLCS